MSRIVPLSAPRLTVISVGHGAVGTLWFAIFLELFLVVGVLYTLASDSIAMHRFQISTFGAVAIVFSVLGVDAGIFTGQAARGAMAAGWLILAVVNILWVLYFTSEEDSLTLHVFNALGTGGLTPPSRRRRTRTQSVHNMGAGNGYGGGYSSPAGVGSAPYDTKMTTNFSPGAGIRSQGSLHGSSGVDGGPPKSLNGAPSIASNMAPGASSMPGENGGVTSPLTTPGNAGVGSGGGPPLPEDTSINSEGYAYKAKALYACECFGETGCSTRTHPVSRFCIA